ncbi:uncharacterized protein BJX67DRAFT_243000 [Aspergillus lucknowensis]|uniref:Uncharacterized protein n=1 Tax=Aspergillus lucknowensis TaxID=176173 RepID=A0ABR4M2Y2_9EURO
MESVRQLDRWDRIPTKATRKVPLWPKASRHPAEICLVDTERRVDAEGITSTGQDIHFAHDFPRMSLQLFCTREINNRQMGLLKGKSHSLSGQPIFVPKPPRFGRKLRAPCSLAKRKPFSHKNFPLVQHCGLPFDCFPESLRFRGPQSGGQHSSALHHVKFLSSRHP